MAFDIKAATEKVLTKATSDPMFFSKLCNDPKKALETLTGMPIPDEAVDKIVKEVKAKLPDGVKKLF